MDVRCPRCGTEYEFDDALVSERGTSVKCTNCGHQFKVHPAKGRGSPERWVVRTVHGRELVYTSLRELQKGIAQRQVGPDDLLSRAGHAPRQLASIAELEPFFRSNPAVTAAPAPGTLVGVAPPHSGGQRPPSQALGETMKSAPAPRTPPPPKVTPPPKPQPPPKPSRSPVEAFVETAQGDLAPESEPPTLPRTNPPEAAAPKAPSEPPPRPTPPPKTRTAPPPTEKAPPPDVRDELVRAPVEEEVVVRETHPMVLTPTPSDVRESYRSYDDLHTDPRFVSGAPPSRRAKSRWIFAVVIIGVIGLFAATVGRKYLDRFLKPTADAEQKTDPRVAEFISKGNQLLSDGDFEGAKEQFDKATVLADRDAKARAALARLSAARADILWLKLRLLDPEDDELVQTTHKLLAERVRKADIAAKKASEVAAEDPTVLRARVDAFRLLGKVPEARELVSKIAGGASDPETAYVLAALDLAEKEPVWSSVVDRLRAAASGEKSLGRARGALVYALARSGDIEEAQAELAKVEANERPHPLINELRAFVRRFENAVGDAGVDGAAEVAAVDPSTLPVINSGGDGDFSGSAEEGPGDFRSMLKQAASAVRSGELERAEALYNAVLSKQPGNTEALAGLGDVARARKDPEAAQRHYDKVLADNPSYLPALIAKADAKWDAGDRAGALVLYRRVLEQAGSGSTYGQRASARIAEGASGGSSPPEPAGDPPESPTEDPPPADPPSDKPESPEIDTTDLPGIDLEE